MSGASRFETDPAVLVDARPHLPDGWLLEPPGPHDTDRLTQLLREHEEHGRGRAGASAEDVHVETSASGRRTRENVVVRDGDGRVQAWASVHDRAGGRMLLVHLVARDLPDPVAEACSAVLVEWAVAQAGEVGAARGVAVQQIDTGAFAGDARQQRLLAAAGFAQARTWWQMVRPVRPDEASLVPDPTGWSRDGVTVRLVREGPDGPDEGDLRTVHDVLEEAFTDHYNSRPETFEEFLRRMREEPGHRWEHWWLAELDTPAGPRPAGALVGTRSGSEGSYVAYVGVLDAARGRGVATGLLHTIVADAAARGRDRVGLEVDADSPTGADRLYAALGWRTDHTTQSWHLDVTVPAAD